MFNEFFFLLNAACLTSDESDVPLFDTTDDKYTVESESLSASMAPQSHTTCSLGTSVSVGIQCELLKTKPETSDVAVGADDIKIETKEVGVHASLPMLTAEDIRNNDSKTRFYTGFRNWGTFWLLFQILLNNHGADRLKFWDGEKKSMDDPSSRKYQKSAASSKPGRQRRLRPEDEYFMVWLRLRHDIRQEMLGDMFKISVKSVSRILNTWINFLYDHFKGLIAWPTREQILMNLPRHFSETGLVRTVLDATEIFCEKPSSLTAQSLTWSDYKSHNTMKLVIGVAPNGFVNFVSKLWGGRASDRLIVHKDGDGFIPLLEPGDIVMADKGFTISDLLPADVGLNMPPFVSKSKQMTQSELTATQKSASPRIVVEMKMEQIKNYRILQNVFDLSEAHLAEQIVMICVASTNLLEPLLV